MMSCVLGSLLNLLWCLVMIFFVQYVFALYFVQGMTDYMVDHTAELGVYEEELIMKFFGSVQAASLSLFMATTNGNDWLFFYDMILPSGTLNSAIFVFYIAFFVVAVWNVITSTFVEKALKLAQPDVDTLMLEKANRDEKDALEMAKWLESMKMKGSGEKSSSMSQAEFTELIQGPLETFLHVRGVNVTDAETLFKMLTNATGTDRVDLQTFVAGCLRMKGAATNVGLHTLDYKTQVMRKEHMRCWRASQMQLRKIEKSVDHLMNSLGVQPPAQSGNHKQGEP